MFFITLKVIHFLALLMGGAAAIAPGLMQRALRLTGHDGPPPKSTAMTMRILGIMGLIAIVLLWVTGIGMVSMGYDGATIGMMFWVKLLAAAAILVASVILNLMAARAAREGTPPNPGLVKGLQMLTRGALLLAIIAAAIVFT